MQDNRAQNAIGSTLESNLKREPKTRRAGQKVRKGDKKFLLRIFLGRDAHGKRLYHNEIFFGTSRQADEHLITLQQRRSCGEPLKPSKVTFGEFIDQWLDVVKLRVREDTSFQYERMANTYLRPAFGALRLIDVTDDRIQKHYSNMMEAGLSAATLSYVHTLLTNIFDLAIRRDKLRRNPMDGIDGPRKEQKEVTAMETNQVRKFLTVAESHNVGLIFSLAFYTGARSCEYLGLKWSDLDLAGKRITIQRSLKWRKGAQWYIAEPKTPKSRRSIPLTDPLLKGLADHRTRQLEEQLKAGSSWQQNDFIFASEIGEPIKSYSIRYLYKKILVEAGLPKNFQLRNTRHSCATALMSSNTNPKVVSERLGHSSVKITLDIYSHVSPGMQQEASEQMEKLLLG